jgi:hypothetical protein
MKALTFIFILLFTSAFALEVISDQDDSFAQIVTVEGEVKVAKDKGEWEDLKVGAKISRYSALKTHEKSYVKILLSDNSLVHVGQNTALTIEKDKIFKFNIGRGQLRILSYKNKKEVKTPWGESQLENGEFIWDVYLVNTKMKVALTALSGSISLGEEELRPKVYEEKPDVKPKSTMAYDHSCILYFGEAIEENSYDIAFEPSFPERKLASIEDVIVEDLNSTSAQVEEESFSPVEGDIWVHDVVYDEAVRVIETEAFKKARELVKPAVIEASDGLVWEVASRSVLKWGVQYAQRLSDFQVPLAVQGSYLGKRQDDSSFYEKDAYKTSTEDITRVRTYRAAKMAVLRTGYKKGWMEAQRYAMSMLPKIVVPVVSKSVYEHILPLGKSAVKKVIKKSNLVHTADVDRLVEHLCQVASVKFTNKLIDNYAPYYTKIAAQSAAREAARSAAEDIAYFMAEKSSKRAGKLIGDLLARERARKIARGVAQETKKEDAESSRKRSRRLMIETQR